MPNVILIPLAPITDYIERQGGIAALPGFGIPVEVEIEKAPYVRIKMDRTLEEARALKSARNAYDRLRDSAVAGQVDLFVADAFICKHLKKHPADLYGPEWFEFEADDEPLPTLPTELRVVA